MRRRGPSSSARWPLISRRWERCTPMWQPTWSNSLTSCTSWGILKRLSSWNSVPRLSATSEASPRQTQRVEKTPSAALAAGRAGHWAHFQENEGISASFPYRHNFVPSLAPSRAITSARVPRREEVRGLISCSSASGRAGGGTPGRQLLASADIDELIEVHLSSTRWGAPLPHHPAPAGARGVCASRSEER